MQSFWVFKLTTNRIRDANYKLNITIEQARETGEIVSVGNSLLLKSIRKIKNINFNQYELNELLSEKRRIKNKQNSKANKQLLIDIENKITKILFVPEIISVVVDDVRHYQRIIEHGLKVNGRNYKRIVVGSGNARRNTVIMVDAEIEQELKQILNNDRDLEAKITPAKFSAYFGLCNSAAHEVSTPRFTIIKDCEVKKIRKMNFVVETEGEDDYVVEKDVEITQNYFDGMGIISPERAKLWSEELELNHIPASFIIRGPFLKGLCAVFDFGSFADEVAGGNYQIEDVWGNKVDIRELDCVLTQSQLKLWSSYKSCEEYKNACIKNDLGWSVSRYSPEKDSTHAFTNYQFLQVLDLNDEQIASLCKKTVDYFKGVIGGDRNVALLYLLGELANKGIENDWFDKSKDPISKALSLDESLVKDPYIKSFLASSLNRKINDSYMGKLLVDGNFSMVISDCYAFAQHMFGLTVTGLLQEGEGYSNFWEQRNVNKVVGMRSPLTHFSEPVILDLKTNDKIEKWFCHLNSGIVFNVHGLEMEKMADADKDGDLVLTTNQQEMIDGVRTEFLPITYEKKSAPKVKINDSELWKSDIGAFFTKIGFLTNLASSMMTMLPMFPKGSVEYEELMKRMILARFMQGQFIDSAKGIIAKPMYKHWTKFTRITDEMSEEDVRRAKFNNSLLIEKRPVWMRYLYKKYAEKYKLHDAIYDNYSHTEFGISLKELLEKENATEEEAKIVSDYWKFNPFITTDSIMQKISDYMRSEINPIKTRARKSNSYDYSILMNKSVKLNKDKLKKMKDLIDIFLRGKKNFKHYLDFDDHCENLRQFVRKIQDMATDISTNESELATYAVKILYEKGGDKNFVWKCFPNGLIENIVSNLGKNVFVPIQDNTGDIKFLGKTYSMIKIADNS
jgi:hypothetical protein